MNAELDRRGGKGVGNQSRHSRGDSASYCQGDAITIADSLLASQAAGANFYKYDLAPSLRPCAGPTRACGTDAFARAHPQTSPARRRRLMGADRARPCAGLLHLYNPTRALARWPAQAGHPQRSLAERSHETCNFQGERPHHYGASPDGGIIDLGRKLAKYPTLLDLLGAQAIAEVVRRRGRQTTRSRTWRCCRDTHARQEHLRRHQLSRAQRETRMVGRRRNIPTCSAVFRPRWWGPTRRSCGRRCPTSSITKRANRARDQRQGRPSRSARKRVVDDRRFHARQRRQRARAPAATLQPERHARQEFQQVPCRSVDGHRRRVVAISRSRTGLSRHFRPRCCRQSRRDS